MNNTLTDIRVDLNINVWLIISRMYTCELSTPVVVVGHAVMGGSSNNG